MKNFFLGLLIIVLAATSFCAGWLLTVHNLNIWEDRPARIIYVTDMFGQEWVYDYSPAPNEVVH